METKTCNRCKLELLFTEFRLHKKGKYGLYGICKKCENVQAKEVYSRPGKKGKLAAWREANREHINEQNRAAYWANAEEAREKAKTRQARFRASGGQKKWQEANREHMQEWYKLKRETDSAYRACQNARNRVLSFLKGKTSFSRTLGCSQNEFRSHIESLFQPGMDWNNYGEWEIDHKYPLSKAYVEGSESFSRACHYANLQPLWKSENRRKGHKI